MALDIQQRKTKYRNRRSIPKTTAASSLDSTNNCFGERGDYNLLATLAYNSAMAKNDMDLPSCLQLLSEASDLYPTQPVFPYFRHLRIHDYLNANEQLIDAGSDLQLSNSELIDMARRDLAIAKKLDPNWVAAQR